MPPLIETCTVIIGHSLTAVISMALLLLVLWHAPRLRSNQLFAGMMLLLVIHSLLNIAGRFLQPLQLDPWPVYTLIMALYLGFVLLTFFFSVAFAGLRGGLVQRVRWAAITLGAVTLVSMYTRLTVAEVYPLSGGGFNVIVGPLYIPLCLAVLAFLVFTIGLLARSTNERARRLWPATALILAGYISLVLRPILPLPLNAALLAAAVLWMGYVVLEYQIFNPMAALNHELARTNAELAEANSLKNQFMANMSHELRTPLNSIIGYADLLARQTYGPVNERQEDRLRRIARNGRHLLNLINDILDLSRIESGQVALNLVPIDTVALINSVLATVEPLAESKSITLVREYTNSPPIYGDEIRIRQVLVNLLSNALKFTPQGTVTIHVEPALVGDMVYGYVQDTGIGIPLDKQAIIFEAFRQCDQSPTRQFEGTGLGLTISRHFVEMHGGRLWLESAPGQGATFHFELPGKAQPALIATSANMTSN